MLKPSGMPPAYLKPAIQPKSTASQTQEVHADEVGSDDVPARNPLPLSSESSGKESFVKSQLMQKPPEQSSAQPPLPKHLPSAPPKPAGPKPAMMNPPSSRATDQSPPLSPDGQKAPEKAVESFLSQVQRPPGRQPLTLAIQNLVLNNKLSASDAQKLTKTQSDRLSIDNIQKQILNGNITAKQALSFNAQQMYAAMQFPEIFIDLGMISFAKSVNLTTDQVGNLTFKQLQKYILQGKISLNDATNLTRFQVGDIIREPIATHIDNGQLPFKDALNLNDAGRKHWALLYNEAMGISSGAGDAVAFSGQDLAQLGTLGEADSVNSLLGTQIQAEPAGLNDEVLSDYVHVQPEETDSAMSDFVLVQSETAQPAQPIQPDAVGQFEMEQDESLLTWKKPS